VKFTLFKLIDKSQNIINLSSKLFKCFILWRFSFTCCFI